MGICSSNNTFTEDEIKEIPKFTFDGLLTKAYVCDVYDGDTITCIFRHDERNQKFKIRMYGYDAPEMKPSKRIPVKKRELIIENALSAKKYLADQILNKWIHLECKEFDKYGRILGVIKLNQNDKESINDLMLKLNFGKVYFGGTKEEEFTTIINNVV
jgi:endonuclease YncB( thermonuclease family)